MIIVPLPHYFAEYQRDWDIYVQLSTYPYNAQVHRSTNWVPFNLVLSRPPWIFYIRIAYSFTEKQNSGNIFARTEGKNTTSCLENAPRRWYANEVVSAMIQGWPWSKNSSKATVIYCRTVHIPRTRTNDYICGWESSDWVVRQAVALRQ